MSATIMIPKQVEAELKTWHDAAKGTTFVNGLGLLMSDPRFNLLYAWVYFGLDGDLSEKDQEKGTRELQMIKQLQQDLSYEVIEKPTFKLKIKNPGYLRYIGVRGDQLVLSTREGKKDVQTDFENDAVEAMKESFDFINWDNVQVIKN